MPAGVQKLRREDVEYSAFNRSQRRLAHHHEYAATRPFARFAVAALFLIDDVYQQGRYPGKVAAPASPSQSQ